MNVSRGAACLAASIISASISLLPMQANSSPCSLGSAELTGMAVVEPKLQLLEEVKHLMGGLSENELDVLQTRDIAILVDKSTSMKQEDCRDLSGGVVNRWQWVRQQVSSFVHCCRQLAQKSITLVTFDSEPESFRDVSPQAVSSIFDAAQPQGNTNLAKALNLELQDYFRRKKKSPSQVRPLAIAVITDGLPDSTNLVRLAIKEATHRMTDDSEISIVFLQIGNDPKGGAFLSSLDRKLTNSGATHDIVAVRPFSEMSRLGLGRAVLAAVSNDSRTRTY